MAETTTHPARTADSKADDKSSKSTSIDEKDPRFKFGPAKVQTAEDAVFAYLRDEITEDEFKAACGKFGVLPGTLLRQAQPHGERPDAAFERSIPDEIYDPEADPEDDLEVRQKKVDEKNKAREDAAKEHQQKLENVQLFEQVPVGTTAAAEQQKAAEKEAKESKDTK